MLFDNSVDVDDCANDAVKAEEGVGVDGFEDSIVDEI